MMICLYSSCLFNEICSVFRSKSNHKFGFSCSQLCMVGLTEFFCLCFSSIMLLLHFSNYRDLSLWYLLQCPLMWNICYPTHFLLLTALTSKFSSDILYIFGKIYIQQNSHLQLECVVKQIQVHCFFAFSFIFCILGLDSTKHSGVDLNAKLQVLKCKVRSFLTALPR